MKIRLTQIEDGDYQQLYRSSVKIGQPEHGGEDPDTYFYVRVEYTDEWGDRNDKLPKYHATICACGPGWPTPDDLASCLNSMGLDRETWNSGSIDAQCQELIGYGLYAPIWQESGNNLSKLLKSARQELIAVSMLAGFYLDKHCNAIGSTGWDFMRGTVAFGAISGICD